MTVEKNALEKSCRVSKGTCGSAIGLTFEWKYQGKMKVNFIFLNAMLYFLLHKLILLVILCIKVLGYNNQRVIILQDISYFILILFDLEYEISRKVLIFRRSYFNIFICRIQGGIN